MKTLVSRLTLGAVVATAFAVSCSPKPATEAADAAAKAVDAPVTDAATDAAAVDNDASTAAAATVVEPAALEALSKMGAYLRTLQSFEVVATTTTDTVLDSGLLVQLGGKVTYRVRRPNAFTITNDTDRKKRTLYYDGKTFTLFAPRMKYYAQVDAPPTTKEAVAVIEDKYGIEMPLADLFYWGTDDADTSDITSGIHVGLATVDGVACSQYAFRQGDVDWQVFIQTGEHPVPRKVVITSRTDEARPQFTALMTWKENPTFTDATFVFKPTADSHRIQIVDQQS